MRYSFKKGFTWLGIYSLLVLFPLILAYLGSLPSQRTFWTEFGVALGLIGLGMFCVQFLFSGRFVKIAPEFGMDNLIQLHKEMGLISFFFVLAHPIILLLDNPVFIEYLDPSVKWLRTVALITAILSLFTIVGISLWRKYFQLSYEKWRLYHGILAFIIIGVGLGHAFHVSHYMEPVWKKVGLFLFVGASAYLLFYTRIIRPKKNRKRPYKIVEVKKELEDCYSIILASIDHERLKFMAGQFVWITIQPTPYSLQQHPFSISSSELDPNLTLTIKELGDFTEEIRDTEVGTIAYLEGPFGSFVIKPNRNIFLLMGGIGITPGMSMLRTWKDQRNQGKAILIYANKNRDDITFKEELDDLCSFINLKVVHVLEEADESWDGEKGLLDEKMLKKYIPENQDAFDYFICGPAPFMDIAEIELRNLDVDWRNVYAERFEIV
jgi:predicted ferric reductase